MDGEGFSGLFVSECTSKTPWGRPPPNYLMSYHVSRADEQTIEAAKTLLWKIVRSRLVTANDLIPLAMTLKVLDALPELGDPENISIVLSGPAKRYEQKDILPWWAVSLEGSTISISSGVRHGEDSGNAGSQLGYNWSIEPECESKSHGVLAELGVYDADIGFPSQVREINLDHEGYRLLATRQETKRQGEQVAAAVDESEAALSRYANFQKAAESPHFYFSSPQRCNLCGIDLTERFYFVDGQVGDSGEWRDMCSRCFFGKGAKIGWGKGQLYHRQPDGKWLLVAGFPD